jgi:PH (Pleckstrin Homology) domain-containing protein
MTARLLGFDEIVLPAGERLIWQDRPGAKALALRVFHIRLVVGYFALLFAARLGFGAFEQQPWRDALAAASRVAIPLAIVLTLLGGLALLYSRTTRYSLTNRRLLVQFGAVLPMTLNIPFGQVASAGVKKYADGSGDLPLTVNSEQRLAFLLLWPHVRPWRLTQVEPMLRCVPDASRVADLLAQALRAASSQGPEPAVAAMPAPRPQQPTAAIATAA